MFLGYRGVEIIHEGGREEKGQEMAKQEFLHSVCQPAVLKEGDKKRRQNATRTEGFGGSREGSS